MNTAEDLLKECAVLAAAVEEISSEMPKLKKQFQKCEKLKETIFIQAQEREKELDDKMKQYEKRLNAMLQTADSSIRKYESLCTTFRQMGDFLEQFRKYEEKTENLEQRLRIMAACQIQNPVEKGTLGEIIVSNGCVLPITVIHDRWKNYRFTVLDVKDGMVNGKLWREDYGKESVINPTKSYPLQNAGFHLYVKQEKTAENRTSDGFMNIPEVMEEAPF